MYGRIATRQLNPTLPLWSAIPMGMELVTSWMLCIASAICIRLDLLAGGVRLSGMRNGGRRFEAVGGVPPGSGPPPGDVELLFPPLSSFFLEQAGSVRRATVTARVRAAAVRDVDIE